MSWDQDLFKTLLDAASELHGAQKTPGKDYPYVTHVTKVATEVMAVADASFDVNLAMACAVLHDSVEDAGATAEQLEAKFGPKVAAGVQALTKDASLPKAQRMADSLKRIQAQPKEVWMVKLADRITNLEEPPHDWTVEKRKKYLAEAKEILDALGSAHAGLAARLRAKMVAYEAWCR